MSIQVYKMDTREWIDTNACGHFALARKYLMIKINSNNVSDDLTLPATISQIETMN